MQCFAATALVLVIGCSEPGAGAEHVGVDAGTRVADWIVDPAVPGWSPFDSDHVIEVAVEMDPNDWNALRLQTRSIVDIYGGECLAKPFAKPYSYFPADVVIDGVHEDAVGIRKKGFFGSVDNRRPALKIKFDKYVDGQRLAGLKRLTLNNSKQDGAYVRQCLTYDLFRDAGLAAPRCNFAHVVVNGTDLGVYVNVESVDKRFLDRIYGDGSGNLYEGTLSDFRPDWVGTFEKDTNEDVPDRSDLLALVDALAVPDEELLATLHQHFDIDEFTTHWAMEVLTKFWDGYAGNTNNYFIYGNPGSGRFHFIPWGPDGTLDPKRTLLGGYESVTAMGVLAARLYANPEMRAAYFERLDTLLDDVWDETHILSEIDTMAARVRPLIDTDELAQFESNVVKVRDVVTARRGEIVDELAEGEPAWNRSLRAPPCFHKVGHVGASFRTTWGSISDPDNKVGDTATVELQLDSAQAASSAAVVSAGFDPIVFRKPGIEGARAWIQMSMSREGGGHLVVVLRVKQHHFFSGEQHPIDWINIAGEVYEYDAATGTKTRLGLFADGPFHLDAGAMTPGAPVIGWFESDIYQF